MHHQISDNHSGPEMLTLQEARRRAGLTQAQLAERIGRSVDSVRSWEIGRRRPSPAILADLLAVLGGGWCLSGDPRTK